MRILLLILFILSPAVASATTGVFNVPTSDKSMQYLGMVFGSIAGLPITSTGNALFGQVIGVFNNVIFALSTIIIAYTTVIGSINTAQEGQFLGKKWHPILTPIRAALGLYLLLPVAGGGYNWIQVTVMWFIVQGVGAANALWAQAVTQNATDGSIHLDTKINPISYTSVFSIFEGVLCMEKINSTESLSTPVNDQIPTMEAITIYRNLNRIEFGRIGRQGTEGAICGSIDIPSLSDSMLPEGEASAERIDILGSAILSIAASLQPAAQEALMHNDSATYYQSFTQGASILSSTAQSLRTTFANLDKVTQDAITNGWIHAGSYYFTLVTGRGGAGGSEDLKLVYSGINSTLMKQKLGDVNTASLSTAISQALKDYKADVIEQQDTAAAAIDRGGRKLSMSAHPGSQATSIGELILGAISESVINILNDDLSTGGGYRDPIISMRNVGVSLSFAAETTFWISLVVVLIAWMVTAIMSCIQPIGHALDYTLMIVVPIAVLILSLLWASGIMLALYVPMIPYLVFTFAALSWIILVIEAMLGAPLIALTLIIPSEEEIGKAGHAMVILLGLFLRPALMVLGFILAIKLLMVAIQMLNFGFWATLVDTGATSKMGIFALVSLVMLYSSIAVSLVHEAFSLVYMIPNQVLRWMGAHGEGDDAGAKAKEIKGSVEKGTSAGGNMMKGGLSAGQSKYASMVKKT